jgi:hypothetical protein
MNIFTCDCGWQGENPKISSDPIGCNLYQNYYVCPICNNLGLSVSETLETDNITKVSTQTFLNNDS